MAIITDKKCWKCGATMMEEKTDKSGRKYLQCAKCEATDVDMENHGPLPRRNGSMTVKDGIVAPRKNKR